MIKNILLETSYDGALFSGFQYQKDQRSVEEELTKAIRKVTGEENRIVSCGRTDSGVHAYGQVLHFDTDLNIPTDGWVKAINAMIPKDIRIVSAKVVNDEFHVRYNSIKKTYIYKLYLGKEIDPFLINYVGQHKFNFNFEKAKETLQYFI